ncbi:MAG: hypothetical protein K2J47_07855 [Ruminococcus sp.]|nr:hypothetical protein [Ruminococcus sp.]
MNCRHIIYVPKTAEDMKSDWFGDETADTYEWNLSDDEFNALWDCGVFEYLNAKFDVMIDAFEEELILYQYLYFHYEELIEELNRFKCRHEVKILIKMINLTIKGRTYIGFFL